MVDDEDRRFQIGDEVRVRKGAYLPEMKPELQSAVGVIGDVADRQAGQTITVMYRELGFYGSNLPAGKFELVKRCATPQRYAPSLRGFR